MKLGIMQPYFLPYIGYFQLISMTDKYVVYDNIEYTKKGWINRNRFLCGGTDKTFTVPLKKASDYSMVVEREVSQEFDKKKLLKQFEAAYRKAPYFSTVMPLLESIVLYDESNLFRYIFNSIVAICDWLDIKTELVISSDVNINHSLKGQDKVIALCKAMEADVYINTIGGAELYDREEFKKHNIQLYFYQCNDIVYPQFNNDFVQALSIVDVMMFNDKEKVKDMLKEYSLC